MGVRRPGGGRADPDQRRDLRVRGDHACPDAAAATRRQRAGLQHCLAAAAPSFVDRVAAASPASSLRGWAGAPGYLRRCWGPGWALVGDAGYFKDPITTHGMTDALRDAELLADALLAVLSGAPEAPPWPRTSAPGTALSSQLFDATEEVAAFDWDLNRVRLLLREVSCGDGDEVDHLQALPQCASGVTVG